MLTVLNRTRPPALQWLATVAEGWAEQPAAGAICVVEGQLTETYVPGPEATRLRRRRLGLGAVAAFGPDHIHDVVNTGSTQALSIQVYTPRLVTMTYYAFHGRRGLEAVRTELSDHPKVVRDKSGWVAV